MPDGRIRIVLGRLDTVVYEMAAYAIVLSHDAQAIANRAAETLRLIAGAPDNFFALLDGSEGCAFCGRALKDEISKLVSIGPDCAGQYHIPHNRAAAERRLIRRRELLEEEL
jgi:Family of unknown function (DUF6011)